MKNCKYCNKILKNNQVAGHQLNCKLNPDKKIGYRNFMHYPQWVVDIFNKEKINFNDALLITQNEEEIKTKKLFYGICEICKNEFMFSIQRLRYRKWKKQICGKCYVPNFVTKQKEWIEKNRQAQIIAQNKPETLKKNSESVKRFWKNHPEVKKRIGKKISILHQDENYRSRVHGSIYKGKIETKWGLIRFESLLELNFIINKTNDETVQNFKRWDKSGILYLRNDGKYSRYYPDFIINNERVIEIKSKFVIEMHRDNLNSKEKAFKNFYPNLRFSMLSEDFVKTFYNGKNKSLLDLIKNFNIIFFNDKIKEKINNILQRYSI